MSFDAWGQRRAAADWTVLALLRLTDTTHGRYTTRGFTGHEMLDAVGIIHMNGRIYDPKLGRFMQADPVIQFPNYAQSRNSYSYVLNNPLAYTDPSSHSPDGSLNLTYFGEVSRAGHAVFVMGCLTSITLSAWRQSLWPFCLYQGLAVLLLLSITPSFQFDDGVIFPR